MNPSEVIFTWKNAKLKSHKEEVENNKVLLFHLTLNKLEIKVQMVLVSVWVGG